MKISAGRGAPKESVLLCIESEKFSEFHFNRKLSPKMFYSHSCQRCIDLGKERDPWDRFFIGLKERPFPDEKVTEVQHLYKMAHLL